MRQEHVTVEMMQSGTLFQKVVAVVLFLGILYPLYLIGKIVVLAITLYIAGVIYSLNGGTSIEAFQASTAHALLIGADYILSILLAVYLTWKIVKRVLKALFPPQANPRS